MTCPDPPTGLQGSRAAAAAAAVAPLLDAAFSVLTLPEQEAGRLLLLIASEAGVLLSLSGGQIRAEAWHSDGGSLPAADTTVRFDSLETLQRVLDNPAGVPALLLRRKLRMEGSMVWLERLRSSLSPSQADPRMTATLLAELSAAVSGALSTEAAEGGLELGGSLCSAASGLSASWVPNEASFVCMECQRPFTPFRRRHHCRGCGRLLCAKCAPLVAWPGGQGCPMALGRIAPTKRLCHACPAGSVSQRSSFVCSAADSGAAARPSGAVASHPLFTATGGGDSAQVAELRAQLDALRREEAEREVVRREVVLRQEAAQIWQATQLILLVFSLSLLLLSVWVFGVWTACCVALYLSPPTMLHRHLHVSWAAFAFVVKFKLARKRVRLCRLQGKEASDELRATDRVLGRFLFWQITELRGFWTKLGQQLSMNPVVPEVFRQELAKCQDQVPSAPVADVLRTVREEFGAATAARLAVDPSAPPLGTASIGQVHRAKWLEPGAAAPRDIVLKVQHRGVEKVFRQDLLMATVLAWLLAKIDPEGFPDTMLIVGFVKKITLNELDFRLEAANQIRGARAVRENGVDVLVPEVIPELVARRAMAMEYVDGVPLAKIEEELPQVDRTLLVRALADHYGVQFAVDGHFHADPHPGNLMVERSTGRLTVLDWGMCVTLPPSTVKAYAKLFVAASTCDCWVYAQAVEACGVTFKGGDVFEPRVFVDIFRFFLRDSQPMSSSEAQMGEMMRLGEDLYKNGPKRYQKSSFDVISGDLVFLNKASELIFGVAGQLGVAHPILLSLLRRAYPALVGRGLGLAPCPLPRSPHELLPNVCAAASPAARGPLEERLSSLLRDLYRQGLILGAQLCVLELPAAEDGPGANVSVIADVAVGVRTWLNPEPVEPETVFQLLDVSKLPLALAMLRLVDGGRLRLGDVLIDRWPAFGVPSVAAEGKRKGKSAEQKEPSACAGVTLEHVLGHTAGLWWAVPKGLKQLPELVDFEAALSSWASSPPVETPGQRQRYHHAAFGFVCAGACRHLGGCEIERAWEELVSVAASASEWSGGSGASRKLRLRLSLEEVAKAAHFQGHMSTTTADVVLRDMTRLGAHRGMMSVEQEAVSAVERAGQQLWGREHLVDMSLFTGQAPGVAGALLPGMQAFGTARGVAELLAATASGSVISPGLLREATCSRRPAGTAADTELAEEFASVFRLESFEEWGLGLQLVQPSMWSGGSGGNAAQRRPPAWGHLSQSGSAALVLPGPKPKAVTLLLNLGTPQGSGQTHRVAWEVLRAVDNFSEARA